MQSRQIKWKEPLRIFFLSRIVILLTSAISIFILPQFFPALRGQIALSSPYASSSPLSLYFNAWFRWDVKAYVNISSFGYKYTPYTAFFPLWPLLQRWGGFLLGGIFPASYYFAGLFLSNIFFFFALILLYHLVSKDFDPALSNRTLIYFTFAPYAIFFFVGYTESLFVFLCLAFFLFLRRGRRQDWWLAGICGFFAALTRSVGVLLVVPFFVRYIQCFWNFSLLRKITAKQESNDCLPIDRSDARQLHFWWQKLVYLIPILFFPAATLIYIFYLGLTKGDPWLFKTVQEKFWHLYFTSPWDTYLLMIKAITSSGSSLSLPYSSLSLHGSALIVIGLAGTNMLYCFFAILPLIALILGWKQIPLNYAIFCLFYIIFLLSMVSHINLPFYSHPRYMIVLFPISIIFAAWGRHPLFHRPVIILSLIMFVVNTILFTLGLWAS